MKLLRMRLMSNVSYRSRNLHMSTTLGTTHVFDTCRYFQIQIISNREKTNSSFQFSSSKDVTWKLSNRKCWLVRWINRCWAWSKAFSHTDFSNRFDVAKICSKCDRCWRRFSSQRAYFFLLIFFYWLVWKVFRRRMKKSNRSVLSNRFVPSKPKKSKKSKQFYQFWSLAAIDHVRCNCTSKRWFGNIWRSVSSVDSLFIVLEFEKVVKQIQFSLVSTVTTKKRFQQRNILPMRFIQSLRFITLQRFHLFDQIFVLVTRSRAVARRRTF